MQALLSPPLRVLVTGTSRGLGYDLVKQLATLRQEVFIVTTVRSNVAVAQQKWNKLLPNKHKITCYQLDIKDANSIDAFVKEMQTRRISFDVIVNNAAVGGDLATESTVQGSKEVLAINFIGTVKFTQKMLPLLTPFARIVNVSSLLGALRFHPPHTQERFSKEGLSFQQLLEAADKYVKDVQMQCMEDWDMSNYGTSKMLLNYWSRFILQYMRDQYRKQWLGRWQRVVSMSPGHCRTDMGGQQALNSCESGAKTIYQCIFMENTDSEVFYHRARPSDFLGCGQQYSAQNQSI